MERFRGQLVPFWMLLLLLVLLLEHLELGSSLNDEGKALLRFREAIEVDPYASLATWVEEDDVGDPCLWAGVTCEDGGVVSLNLNSLSLMGTLTLELCKLVHLKYLNLSNNSFYGVIPKEIEELRTLEALDLGYNNLHGPLPSNLGNLLLLRVLVLKGNQFPHDLSELQGDGNLLSYKGRSVSRKIGVTIRRLLQGPQAAPMSLGAAPGPGPAPVPTPTPSSHSPPPPPPPPPPLPPPPPPPPTQGPSNKKDNRTISITVSVAAVSVVLVAAVVFVIFYQKNKEPAVKPLGTGLSGQLKKAFVEGVQSLKELELRTACEDYSNVIGKERLDCTLFKGTLSSGVEIAVNCFKTDGNWTKCSQEQFRRRIATLSKVSHKNFVSLIGYCEETGKKLSRMMVFEYASNGTLFEHLHVKEEQADHLNWAARLRIAMGVAYCLDHMHQLDPPVILGNIDSTTILLTDDFAAKIVDLELWSQTHEMDSRTSGPILYQMPDQYTVVHKFGIILLELVSGRPPYSVEIGRLVDWASDYLKGVKPLEEMLDPTLNSFSADTVRPICQVIHSCLNPQPRERPSMRDVVTRLREITSIAPDGAAPRQSPVWWAELEIVSSASN